MPHPELVGFVCGLFAGLTGPYVLWDLTGWQANKKANIILAIALALAGIIIGHQWGK